MSGLVGKEIISAVGYAKRWYGTIYARMAGISLFIFSISALSIQLFRTFGLFYQIGFIGMEKNGFLSYNPLTQKLTRTPFNFLNWAGRILF